MAMKHIGWLGLGMIAAAALFCAGCGARHAALDAWRVTSIKQESFHGNGRMAFTGTTARLVHASTKERLNISEGQSVAIHGDRYVITKISTNGADTKCMRTGEEYLIPILTTADAKRFGI